MAILFPVAYKVAKNIGRVLELFGDIAPKDVKAQYI